MFFYQVINHGLSENLIEEVLKVNANFFGLPLVTKEELISDDIYKPVRFTSNQGGAQGMSREFLKLYAHPFEEFMASWPKNPPDYRYDFWFYSFPAAAEWERVRVK